MTAQFADRDPNDVRRELRWRRAAAAMLLHHLDGNEEGRAAAMQLVLVECHAYSMAPSTVLLEPVMDLVAGYVRGADRERLTEALRAEMLHNANVSGPPDPPDGDDA